MATLFGSPPFLSLSKTRTHRFSSSSSSTQAPPPLPPSQPPLLSPTSSQLLSTILTQQPSPLSAKVQQPQKPAATESAVESSDWIASTTLTRRFGLGSGIAWATFLGIGVLSQHLKTGLDEVSLQEENTGDVEKQEEVVLPNGIRYFDLRVGGGAAPRPGGGGGDLVVIDLRGNIQGRTEQVFVDTFGGSEKTPQVAVVMAAGWSRPYEKGMCEGIECLLRSMKAGGRRRVIVPPSLGFGEKGADFGCGFQIPPNVALEYVVEVDKVSILHPPIA